MKIGKYTAKEIIAMVMEQEGIDEPEYGKVRIRIAGIRGIVSPDHRIHIQEGTKEVQVVIGDKEYSLKVEA